MNKKVLVAGISAVAVLTAAACGDSSSETATSPNGSSVTSVITASAEEDAAHNQADVMFAQMMIPHHEQAIEMSDIILAKNAIPEPVMGLAEQIKAAQGPEIEQLRAWLEQWDASAMPDGDHNMPDMDGQLPDMHEMEGMLSEQDLQQLSDAEGTEAARLFLTQMIAHHEGAVSMAETEIDDGQFPDAVAMALTIVETQQDEIDTMRELLATL